MRIYTIDGVPYISVTSILSLMFPFNKRHYIKWCKENGIDHKEVTEYSQRLGTMVSTWVELRHLGLRELDPLPLMDKELRYRRGVDTFCSDWDILASEQVIVCPELKYAGRLDAIAQKPGGIPKYIDFKSWGAWKEEFDPESTGTKKKLRKAQVQLSMYQYADQPDGIPAYEQSVIVFTPDGSYEEFELEYTDEFVPWIKKNQDKINKQLDGKIQPGEGAEGDE
jgi:hypothetical protein